MNWPQKVCLAVVLTLPACGDDADNKADVSATSLSRPEAAEDDSLEDHRLEGRLQWLLKCEYISAWRLVVYLHDHEYPVFIKRGSDDPDEPCRDLGRKLGSNLTLTPAVSTE